MDSNKTKFVVIGLIVFVITIIVFLFLLFSNQEEKKTFGWSSISNNLVNLNN